jgi:hypothetical protein
MTAYLKAIVAALIAGLTAVLSQWEDGGLTAQEIVTSVIAFLVALGAVWATPNSTPSTE